MKKEFSSKTRAEKKKHSKQIGIRDFVMVLMKSRIPWIWVLILFLFNLSYNRILYSIPTTTGRLMGGDLSAQALAEALISYGLYALFAVVQYLIRAFAYSTTSRNARNQLWSRMLRIKESFYDKIDRSEMLTTVTYDISSGVPGMVTLIVEVIPDLIYVGKALRMIETYDPLLLVIVILFIPLKYVYMIVVGRWVYRTEARLRENTGILTSRLDERLKNVSLIKSFNKETQEAQIGGEYIEELYKANVAVAKLGGISLSVQQGIELIQKFILMVVAVILLQQGRIDIAQWIAFFLFSTNLSSKFDTLISHWMNVKQISGNLHRPVKLYHAPLEDMKEEGQAVGKDQTYDLSFQDVSFSYEEKKALSHISFTIADGAKVAIVGKSGSGKSTTLSLIERFYEPEKGQIRMGSVPIDALKMEDYRNKIAYVPQNHQVFSGTIREALTYGNAQSLSDEVLLQRASETGFSQYLDLQEKGLDTVISGSNAMSGGQLQKLIITREKLRESRIVLLDEPASALDAESTQMVKKLVTEDLKEKTVIMVTHDLSFVDAMDQIIMLDEGELVASGTYPELVRTCQPFRRLLETQGMEVTA